MRVRTIWRNVPAVLAMCTRLIHSSFYLYLTPVCLQIECRRGDSENEINVEKWEISKCTFSLKGSSMQPVTYSPMSVFPSQFVNTLWMLHCTVTQIAFMVSFGGSASRIQVVKKRLVQIVGSRWVVFQFIRSLVTISQDLIAGMAVHGGSDQGFRSTCLGPNTTAYYPGSWTVDRTLSFHMEGAWLRKSCQPLNQRCCLVTARLRSMSPSFLCLTLTWLLSPDSSFWNPPGILHLSPWSFRDRYYDVVSASSLAANILLFTLSFNVKLAGHH